MCWQTISREHQDMLVAKADIKVYKYLRKKGPLLLSPVMKMAWAEGVLYKATPNIVASEFYFVLEMALQEIEEGLHCMATPTESMLYDKDMYVYEATIPKDSIYYQNEHGHIVTEQLIIDGCSSRLKKIVTNIYNFFFIGQTR